MDHENSGKTIMAQGKNQVKVISSTDRRNDVEFVDEKFGISKTVNKLHSMMEEVTKNDINSRTVNAACNCINQLNATINTTIAAARFLRENA